MKPPLFVAMKGYTLIVVLVIYTVSFCLPTIDDGRQQTGILRNPSVTDPYFDRSNLFGWEVFCQVILNLPFSLHFFPAWLANAVLWFGLFALAKERWRRARIAAWLCVALSLSVPLAARNDTSWLTLLIGYYVWLVSMVAFLIGVEALRPSAVTKGRITH